MEKLTKDLYIKHAKRLQAIINEQSSFAKYLARTDFANILQSQLNMLFALQSKFKKEKVANNLLAQNLVKVFNKITKLNFKLNEKFKLDDDADYIDSMNYLVTYCSNIFKVNIDDLVEGKKVNVAEPNVQIKPETDDIPSQEGNMFGAAAMGAAFMDPKQNPFVVGQASAKLQKEIINGQFYRFKTKPKAIPIIKWIATILVMLTSLGLILMSIFAFMANGIQADLGGEVGKQPIPTITDGIFFLLFAGIGVYNTVTFFQTNLSKNPNDKFYFSWQVLLIFIIGAIFANLFCINDVFQLGFTYQDDISTPIQVLGKNAWHYIWFVNIALTGACIIPIILGSIFNPKVDASSIDKRLGEIIDSLTAGYRQTSQPSKPEVQKPVDVKKPEDKKDKKKE